MVTKTDAIRRPLDRNKILLKISLGLFFLLVPVAIIIVDPVHLIVKYKLRLAKGGLLESLMQQEIPGAHLHMYLFNVTNADRFMAGEDPKMKVEEVGPFVYLEYLWFENMTFNDDAETLTMTPRLRSEFVPEMSIAHDTAVNLTLPNLPFLSSITLLTEYSAWARYAYNQVVRSIGGKALKVVSVHDYIWGYEEPIMTWFYRMAPGKIYFKTIGLLDRLYDQESDYVVEVSTRNADKFKLNWVKKHRHLDMGGYEHVEVSELVFNDTYEGFGFPPDLTPEVPINIYRLGMCKTFGLEYSHTKAMDYGGEALVYEISNQTFQAADGAVPNGLLDISSCYYNLPLALSKGHYLDADPKLLDYVEGLKPDRSVHVNQITIDRKEAFVVNTTMSIQMSMVLGDVSYNSEAAKLANSVIPIAHVRLQQVEMTENILSIFVLVNKIIPYIMMAVEAAMIFIGLALVGSAVRVVWLHLTCKQMMVFETETKCVETPLINGKESPR